MYWSDDVKVYIATYYSYLECSQNSHQLWNKPKLSLPNESYMYCRCSFFALSLRVAVLHPLPPTSDIPATRTLGCPHPGPRFEEGGMFVQHSVLGPPEEYALDLKNKGLVGDRHLFT